MKPTSKIFLIFAAVLLVIGVIVCIVASASAAKAGVVLFVKRDEDGNTRAVKDFSSDAINAITLDVENAQVNIIGGAESSYIEIINFNENLYSYDQSPVAIEFHEKPDLNSVWKFWDSNSFKGLRHWLFSATNNLGEKEINVYLSADKSVKHFNITGANTNVSVSDLTSDSDYSVKITTGSVDFDNITTASSVAVAAERELWLDVSSLSAKSLTISADKGHITCVDTDEGKTEIPALTTGRLKCTLASGDADFNCLITAALYRVTIESTDIIVNNQPYKEKYSNASELSSSGNVAAAVDDKVTNDWEPFIEITGGKAEITLVHAPHVAADAAPDAAAKQQGG